MSAVFSHEFAVPIRNRPAARRVGWGMANLVLKIAGALAIAGIVVPPFAHVGTTIATRLAFAEAHTYGTEGDTATNSVVDANRHAGPFAFVRSAHAEPANSTLLSSAIAPDRCPPGQLPATLRLYCPPDVGHCLHGIAAQRGQYLSCAPSHALAGASPSDMRAALPPSAVQ